MGRTEAPKTISRYSLVMTLQRQFNGNSPFVIKKDGKEVYDFLQDKLTFTCCNNMEHQHTMTPLRMLQLVYIYGSNPCPICNPKGLRPSRKEKDKGSFGQEDGSMISETKKYLASDDPTETAKRTAEVQIELEEEKRKQKELEKKREKELKESEEDIVESVPYDEYVENENPNFNPDKITTVDSENNIEEKSVEEFKEENVVSEDDEIIAESETYDEYVLKNPNFDEKIIGNDALNRKPRDIFECMLNSASEEGSTFAREKEDHVNEAKQKHEQRDKLNITKEIKQEPIQEEVTEISRENDNTNITKLADEVAEDVQNENLNEDDTNILLSESKENEKTSSDDEEEEFNF